METIYDPVYQWNYNGTAEGAVRNDKKYCGRFSISAVDAKDKSGAWLNGECGKKVEKVSDGCLTIALHGRFPSKADKVAIASLGSAKVGENGKALLLTTGGGDALAAHVIAKVPGQGFTVVSTTPIPLPVSRSPFPVSRSPFPVPRFPFPVPQFCGVSHLLSFPSPVQMKTCGTSAFAAGLTQTTHEIATINATTSFIGQPLFHSQ